MVGIKPLAIRCIPLAAVLAQSSPAQAQCRLCEQPTGGRPIAGEIDDIQVQIETNLEFDRLVILGPGSGAATMRPDGSSGAEGSIGAVGPRARVGTVLVHGQPNRPIRVEIPRHIELYSL